MQLTINTFITDILANVDEVTAHFVENGFKAISGYWLTSGLMLSVLTLYAVYFLYQVKDQDIPLSDSVTHLIKVCFVYVLVTNWDVFYILIYNVTTNEPIAIANALLGNKADMHGGLNAVFSQGLNKSFTLLSNMSFSVKSVVLSILGAVLLIVGTCLFTLTGIGLIVISKFYLAVLLALAPYFIACILFQSTRGLTESWVKSCLNMALIPVFVGCVLLLTVTLANGCMPSDAAGFSAHKTPDFSGIVLYLVCSIISLYLFKTIPEKTASLTASLAMAGSGRIVGHASNMLNKTSDGIKQRVSSAKNGFKSRQQSMYSEIAQRAQQRKEQSEAASAARSRAGY